MPNPSENFIYSHLLLSSQILPICILFDYGINCISVQSESQKASKFCHLGVFFWESVHFLCHRLALHFYDNFNCIRYDLSHVGNKIRNCGSIKLFFEIIYVCLSFLSNLFVPFALIQNLGRIWKCGDLTAYLFKKWIKQLPEVFSHVPKIYLWKCTIVCRNTEILWTILLVWDLCICDKFVELVIHDLQNRSWIIADCF